MTRFDTVGVVAHPERDVQPGGCLAVSKNPDPGHLVRLGGMNFYGRARPKLRVADPPVFTVPDAP
jgi:hypothetical protein